MSTVVKCNTCNIVINEVLAFICNKIDVMDEQSLSRICETAFSDCDIVNAKTLLFESIPASKMKTRKRKGKTIRDIDDIICLLKETDPELVPIFTARELHKLPPVLFDHLDATRILKDLVKLRQDVDRITKEYATVEDLKVLKCDIQNRSVQNQPSRVNLKRGACLLNSFEYNSGPTGMFPLEIVNQLPTYNNEDVAIFADPIAQGKSENLPTKSVGKLSADRDASNEPSAMTRQSPPQTPCSLSLSHLQSLTPSGPVTRSHPVADTKLAEEPDCQSPPQCKQSFANVIKAKGEWLLEKPSNEWKEAQRKRYRNRFTGNKGKAIVNTENNFRAADRKSPIYIYNVSKETTETDIMSHILSRTNLNVSLKKWNMKQNKDYNAYKIFVPENKLDIFLNDTFWPVGISFRRFITFRRKKDREESKKQL